MDSKDCWLKNNCKKLHCDDPNGCMILYKLDFLYKEAMVPVNLRTRIDLYVDSDGTDMNEFIQLKNIQTNIEEFIQKGNQLLIHSKQCGNGKTAWSLKLLQSYFNKIWLKSSLRCRALFIHVPTLLIALKDNISNKNEYVEHIKENISQCDLVIWDDIGTKNSTIFESENLLSFIDNRILNNKANIFTSNLSDEELHVALGDRLASRVCNLGINITLRGGDKRCFKKN